jgi:anti-sigma regulatory factor (Ser/Thr protein kinase)
VPLISVNGLTKGVLRGDGVWVRNKHMNEAVRISLPPRADSVPIARRAVMEAARRWMTPAQAPPLVLMVSEVVTNAVVHGGDAAQVELAVIEDGGVVRVEVCDEGDGFVPEPKALDRDGEGGYGLYLVEQLADRWGWSRSDCTTVWFELDVERAAAAAATWTG